MNSQPFLFALRKVTGWEGGFGADTQDRGNWTGGKVGVGELKGTNHGISAAAYPHLDIKNLTKEDAKKIYYTDYWLKANCDAINSALSIVVFGSAVNQGVDPATRFLQWSVKTKVDGKFGPKTLAAVKQTHVLKAMVRFTSLRMRTYAKYKKFPRYGSGWFNRCLDVYTKAIIYRAARVVEREGIYDFH